MNDDILSKVLDEILKEQKEIRNLIIIRIQKGNEAAEQYPKIMEKLGEQILKLEAAVTAYSQQPLDMPRLEEAATKEVKRLRQAIEGQPKEVTVNKRVLLFPEACTRENFKTLFISLLGFILLVYGLVVFDRNNREREYLKYKKAWQLLYSVHKEDGKQFLEKIFKLSEEQEEPPLNQPAPGGK
ncbi:hypothetical protein V9K67_09025 [Paraflavisolibacter sp. H34]|uniref:hypothetical protein n=1 Tax=Huijunlia imazamoxiresistens TaxID=3127457 RepID=UPI00301B178A